MAQNILYLKLYEGYLKKLEATPGFEPGVKALQASALPLGHVAIFDVPGNKKPV